MSIVLAVDGGAQQRSATALAADLVRTTGAELTVAHVYAWSRSSEVLGNAYELTVREDAHAILAQASEQLGEVTHTTRAIPEPSVPKGLHTLCEELNADLLVIGSSHRGALGRTLLGSMSDRLVHGAPCPIAIAPRDFDGFRSGRPVTLAVGYDGSSGAVAALAWAAGLAEGLGARLELEGVVEPVVIASPISGVPYDYDRVTAARERANREQLEQAAERISASVAAAYNELEGPVAQRLADVATGADLLVIGSRGYGPVRSIMLGSVGHALASSAPVPLVLVPRPAGEDTPGDDASPTAAVTAATSVTINS